MAIPYYIKALLFDGEPRWNSSKPIGTHAKITYSFMTSNPGQPNDPNFVAFKTDQQKAFVKKSLESWGSVANIQFEFSGDNNEGQIRFGFTSLPGQGMSGAPSPGGSTDVWINNYWSKVAWDATNSSVREREFIRYDFLHEVGHAIGLKHPGPYDISQVENQDAYSKNSDKYLPKGEDNDQYSLMSYNDGLNGRTKYTGSEASPTTPLLYDIATAQYLYGANYTTATGNDIYHFENPNEAVKIAIWDAGGVDTISAANQTLDATINLNNGSFSSIGPRVGGSTDRATDNVAIAFAVQDGVGNIINLIENATGGAGNDKITGNSANNLLKGENGNDYIDAGDGNDIVQAGTGNDTVLLGTGNDLAYGGAGNDYIDGWEGNDILYGGADNSDVGTGNDVLVAWKGDDVIYGGDGDDWLDGSYGNDILHGGTGNDTLGNPVSREGVGGEPGDDQMYGDAGNDKLYGGDGTDTLVGGFGDDILVGGAGNDQLNGYGTTVNNDSQFDKLEGGAGADQFILGGSWGVSYVETGNGFGIIKDFEKGVDRIQLRGKAGQYKLETRSLAGVGNAAADTEIFYTVGGQREKIGEVQDTIGLSFGNNQHFTFV